MNLAELPPLKVYPFTFKHLNIYGNYSLTCIQQASKGSLKSACLRQVLAEYRYISMYLPVLGTGYMLA